MSHINHKLSSEPHHGQSHTVKLAAAVASGLYLLACGMSERRAEPSEKPEGEAEAPAAEVTTGSVAFRLVDAPGEVRALEITATRLEFRSCRGGLRTTIDLPDQTFDLMSLVHGNFLDLADGELQAGSWCEGRLFLEDDGHVVLGDGSVHPFKVPSAGSSGYKMKGEFEVIPGEIETVVTIDFDVDRSLKEKGNGSYTLNPVVSIEDVSYRSTGSAPLPAGTFEGWTSFTAHPDQEDVFDLTGGATIRFFQGSVSEPTEFVVTRWSDVVGKDSDVYAFTDHDEFSVAPEIRIPSTAEYDTARVWLNNTEMLPTQIVGGMAVANIPHFTNVGVEDACRHEDGTPKVYSFWCAGDDKRVLCDGDGNVEGDPIPCHCTEIEGKNAQCHYLWADAPWQDETCLKTTRGYFDGPTHTGVYALDFQDPEDCLQSYDFLCGYERCRVTTTREVDGESLPGCRSQPEIWGNNLCVEELNGDGVPTGAWQFVAHLESIVANDGAVVAQGARLGTMGNTGNIESGGGSCIGMHFHVETGSDTADMRDYDGGEAFPFTEPNPPEQVCAVRDHLDYYEPSVPIEPPEPAPTPGDCEVAFPDADPSDDALGASVGAGAGQSLFCDGVLEGYDGLCPANEDSLTMQYLCPASVLGDPNYPYVGEQVMCGGCTATRAELLGFGLKALVSSEIYSDEISSCAQDLEAPCGDWLLCTEANNLELTSEQRLIADDWQASLIGWSIPRGYFTGDGDVGSELPRSCRANDAILWIEAATLFARLTGLEAGLLDDGVASPVLLSEIRANYDLLAASLSGPSCALPNVEDGGEWWIPGAVALHNAGIYCMEENDGTYTANICGGGEIGDCHPTRYVMATIAARLRGLIPTDSCESIDMTVECAP